MTSVWFEEGVLLTDVYLLSKLTHGHTIPGPAIIIDNNRCVSMSVWECHCYDAPQYNTS